MNRKSFLFAVVFTLCAPFVLPAQTSQYPVIKKISIPGTGGWDYLIVDDAARRVYVSHATQVEVLDADSYEKVGVIPNTPGVHGIALATEFGRGFITAGKSDSVVIFDLKTLKTLGEVKVGKKPDAIIYDPATKHVFAMNGDSDSTTVINAQDGKVVATIPLGGGPEFAAADGQGNVYVNLEEKNEMVHIDSRKNSVAAHWPLAPCEAPSSLAFDAASRRLFAGCRSKVMAVVDADSGRVTATLPIGDHVDAGVYDPATKRVYKSTGDGHVFVFTQDGPDKYTLLESVTTAPRAKTMTMDMKTHRLWIPSLEDNKFTILVLGQ
jgi:YVTN family beta-propeller protein